MMRITPIEKRVQPAKSAEHSLNNVKNHIANFGKTIVQGFVILPYKV